MKHSRISSSDLWSAFLVDLFSQISRSPGNLLIQVRKSGIGQAIILTLGDWDFLLAMRRKSLSDSSLPVPRKSKRWRPKESRAPLITLIEGYSDADIVKAFTKLCEQRPSLRNLLIELLAQLEADPQ